MENTNRRYDIDAIRILAFAWLILYHIGMYYVEGWDWHIKSENQSHILQNFMLWSSPWRMSLLFLLSGLALAFATNKTNNKAIPASKLLKSRFVRIFIPLLIGMYIIVPPQLYFELQDKTQFSSSYWQFFIIYINPFTDLYADFQFGPAGLLTWNHLWFLAYLWHYLLIFMLIRNPLNRLSSALNKKVTDTNIAFVYIIVPLTLLTLFSSLLRQDYPQNHALLNDWNNHVRSFSVFIFGYLIAHNSHFWSLIAKLRYYSLAVGLFGYSLYIIGNYKLLPHFIYTITGLEDFLISLNLWAWLLCILAFSFVYLNKPYKWISKCNPLILPWYILHQSVIIIVVVMLRPLTISLWFEVPLVILLTITSCYLITTCAQQFYIGRLALGIKS